MELLDTIRVVLFGMWCGSFIIWIIKLIEWFRNKTIYNVLKLTMSALLMCIICLTLCVTGMIK